MGSYHDIHHSVCKFLHGLSDLRCGSEPAQKAYPDGVILHTLDKGCVVLLGKYGGGNQVYHLLAFLNRFECRADRDLGFSVSHVSADQTVHYLVGFHIMLGILDCPLLVFGLFEREQFFKLSLPYRIGAVYVSFFGGSCRIQVYKILCDYIDCLLNLRLGLGPLLTAELVKLRSV